MTKKLSNVLTSLLVAGFIFASVSVEAKNKKPVAKKAPAKPVEVKLEAPVVQDTVLAEGLNIKVTKKQLRDRISKIPPMYASRYKTKEGQMQVLDILITEELFYQYALKLGIDKEDSVIKNQITSLKNSYNDRYMNREIRSKINLTDKDLTDFYNQNKAQYLIAPKISILHLQAKNDSVATAVKSALASGQKFTDLINTYSSNDYSKKKKGLINMIRHNKYINGIGNDPELDNLIFACPDTSNVYGPYPTTTGIHFFKKIQHEKEIQKDFSEVKNDIENRLRFDLEKKLSEERIAQLKVKYHVVIKDTLLEKTDFMRLSPAQYDLVIVESDNAMIKMTAKQAYDALQTRYQMERLDITNPKIRATALKNEIDSRIFYAHTIDLGYNELLKDDAEVIQLKHNAILRELYQKEVWNKAIPTQEDKQNYYNQNLKVFTINATRSIRQFTMTDSVKAVKERKNLEALIKKNKTDKILKMFYKVSADTVNNGMIDNIYNNKIIPGLGNDEAYCNAVWALQEGQVSSVIKRAKDGKYVFFYVTKNNPEFVKPMDDPQVKESVENNAKRMLAQKNFENLKAELKIQYNVKINEEKVVVAVSVQELFENAENAQKAFNFKEAVYYYDQIIKEFPNGKDDYKAWFMKAFVYAEDLKDNEKALSLFSEMLKKWPEGELNESANFMIQTLRGDIDPNNMLKD